MTTPAAPTQPAAARLPSRLVSQTGRLAKFGTSDEEVVRVLQHQRNYYIVLKVRKDTEPAEIRKNYLRLQALLHPDKCKHPDASSASAIVNQANETLANPVKKTLYDAYVRDVDTDAPEGMSYADWEAQMALRPINLPKWLEKLLRIPGVALILLILLLIILIPLVLIILVLAFVFWLLCLPINIIKNCFRKPEPLDGDGVEGSPTDAPGAQHMGGASAV